MQILIQLIWLANKLSSDTDAGSTYHTFHNKV